MHVFVWDQVLCNENDSKQIKWRKNNAKKLNVKVIAVPGAGKTTAILEISKQLK